MIRQNSKKNLTFRRPCIVIHSYNKTPGVDGRIILRSTGTGMWGYGLDRAGSGYGQVAGTCECGKKPLGSMKCGEFLD